MEGKVNTSRSLIVIQTGRNIKLIQVNTAIFSYELVLKALKNMKTISLSPKLLFCCESKPIEWPSFSSMITEIILEIKTRQHRDLQRLLQTPHSIVLDKSQIQGPP